MSSLRRRLGSDSEQVPIVINAQRISKDERTYTFSSNKQNVTTDEIEIKRMPKDRTNEFANAIRSLHGRQIIRAAQVRDVRKAKTLQSHGEFMMIAKNVGKDLTSTYTKLEKLTLLCKTKAIFDDKASDVQQLSYIIKEDLKSLNEQLARLQVVCKRQKNPDRVQNQHLFNHSNVVMLSLQSKLATMSNDFKQILSSRSDSIKQAKNRRDKFSLGAGSSNNKQNNPLFFLNNEHEGNEEHKPLINQQQQQLQQVKQEQQSVMAYHDQTDQLIQSRVETMHSIESTIVELGGIFQQLATMVKEQDEMVERIDSNIVDTEMNVEAAHHQILRYFQSVTSNRWFMIKVFMILIFFFTFFAVFLG